jgi:uncharacterized linocin/CFP29 family protein
MQQKGGAAMDAVKIYAELARIISGRGTPVKITVEKVEKDIKKTPRCPK